MNSATTLPLEYIAFDIGRKRIGVARVNTLVGISEALEPITLSGDDIGQALLARIPETVTGIVVGLPRGLDGQQTSQTDEVMAIAEQLARLQTKPVYCIDEAGSSKKAQEQIQQSRIKSIDSLAAGIFLEDFVMFKDKDSLRIGA